MSEFKVPDPTVLFLRGAGAHKNEWEEHGPDALRAPLDVLEDEFCPLAECAIG